MKRALDRPYLPGSSRPTVDTFIRSIQSGARVEGLTHNFYRYPARFPPGFARTAIEALSEPGDVVMDPFMGGGTTGVEALNLRRKFLGADVNPVSLFVTKVKTTPLREGDATAILNWVDFAHNLPSPDHVKLRTGDWRGYTSHVPWWLERQISILLGSTPKLRGSRLRDFAKCTILRTAQWALDNRRRLANSREFLAAHWRHTLHMLANAAPRDGDGPIDAGGLQSKRLLLCRSAEGVDKDRRVSNDWRPVRLVVTSPPYPGVHVLYHRWQVQGRRETGTPFWIVGKEDGHPSSFYTMGPRYAEDLSTYVASLENSFRSIASLLDRKSTIVQLVGFSDPGVQLGPVLEALESAGLEEVRELQGKSIPHRIWRTVPSRKWYAGATSSGTDREVLLIHRLAS
jgi:hypothetical protein